MAVSVETFQRLALEDPEGKWELHRGRLREKPAMTWEHTDVISYLGYLLTHQLDRNAFRVHIDGSRLRREGVTTYIPDVAVVPAALSAPLRGQPNRLEIYDAPLPLVVDVWSPSTGDYDLDAKLPEYRARGDLEIWCIHPYERTLTAWRRQPDGSYLETVYHGGPVAAVSLPNVTIDLDILFA